MGCEIPSVPPIAQRGPSCADCALHVLALWTRRPLALEVCHEYNPYKCERPVKRSGSAGRFVFPRIRRSSASGSGNLRTRSARSLAGRVKDYRSPAVSTRLSQSAAGHRVAEPAGLACGHRPQRQRQAPARQSASYPPPRQRLGYESLASKTPRCDGRGVPTTRYYLLRSDQARHLTGQLCRR